MAQWARPAAPKPKQFRMETFKGNDFTNEPANVSPSRSPYAPNMIRESIGKVRKRTGWHAVKEYPDRINGVHYFYHSEDGVQRRKKIIHAGTKIYMDGGTDDYTEDTELYTDANDAMSVAVQIAGKLIILDGLRILAVKEDFTLSPLEDIAYTPTILIARSPTGGGQLLDPINLINPRRTERFAGEASATVYQLSATDIDTAAVEVKKLNVSGGFDTLVEGTGFTVDRTTGKVTFTPAPGVSPITGEDNVYITYSKTVEGYADKINKCTICTLYGVGGARDRLFVSGGNIPNEDYYSGFNDPTYFGDLWYATIGQDDSAIMGYSIVNNYLATHKNRSDDDTNIFLRSGSLASTGDAVFTRVNAFQGTGAISKYTFGVLETEPLFLTENGIFAVTPSDVLGERYAQNRSYYLNGKLLKEPDLDKAVAVIWNQLYALAVNGSMYLLDGSQYSRPQGDPFSYRQYEGYYWTNIPARVLFVDDEKLCFGTADGRLCEFHTDYDALSSYADEGEPIPAQWLTPEFYGDGFYKDKSFTKIAVLLAAAAATGCRVWALYEGIKELLRDYDATARHFSYANFSYSKFSYKTDTSPQALTEKIKIKKVGKVQFLFENDVINEPFGIYEATSEYTEKR